MSHSHTGFLDSKPFMAWRLRQVATIALLTSAIAACAMLIAIDYLAGSDGTNYQEILSAYAMTRRHLAPVLLLLGLGLTSLVGLITWFIALYSTFRVAGPVYRFSLNLKRQIQEGPLPVEQFRQGDFLQVEHLHFSAAASRLQYHYDTISELTDLALTQLESGEAGCVGGPTDAIQKIQKLEQLVQL